GPAMIKHLRPLFPNLKVLFIAGYTGDVLSSNGFTHPVHSLQKPIMPALLMQAVEALLKP
ncbi:MAG: hypothetical protein C4294_01885, partial [Nitrospiraceae bacterium]